MLVDISTGTLFVISAPSGAGKTSLVKALIESTDNVEVSVSCTTRQPRPGEKNGVNYNFISQDEFIHMLDKNLFLEHAQVFDNYYGTPQPWVVDKLNKGIDIILEIDWFGAQQVRRLKPDCVGIYILPPSREILEQRLRNRKQDSDAIIAKRMDKAIDELTHYVEFDYLVVNDVFEEALADLQAIVRCHRLTHRVQSQKQEVLLQQLLA